MAPFRINHDELAHDLPWQLMHNGPVTLYKRREYFEQDMRALCERGFRVPHLDCRSWVSAEARADALRSGLGLPSHTGRSFDALADSLTEIDVPESSGMFVALDNFQPTPDHNVLLNVLAYASRWWLLFGRIFGVLVRTDDATYDPPQVGATRPAWNSHEWLDQDRRP